MRIVVMVCVALVVLVGVIGLHVAGKSPSEGELALPAARYGSQLGATPSSSVDTHSEPSGLPINSQTSSVVERLLVSTTVNTAVMNSPLDTTGAPGTHMEHEPSNEFSGLAIGEFPVSSNLPEDTEYPLREMVELATKVLEAEVAGVDSELYPHLSNQVSVCCRNLIIDGAAVLFGATPKDPTTIIIEWHADAVDPSQPTVRRSTQSKWFWRDGTWVGEHELINSEVSP